MQETLSYFGYAVFSLLMLALSVPLARLGARRTSPAVGAVLFGLGLTLFALLTAFLSNALFVLPPPKREFPYLLGAGAALGLGCLFLFRAITGGPAVRVVPLLALAFPFDIALRLIQGDFSLTVFRGAYLVLVLLGIVLMVSNSRRYRDPAFPIFAGLAALLYVASRFLVAQIRTNIPPQSLRLSCFSLALLLLFIIALAGKSWRFLKRMTLERTLLTLTAGISAGVGLLSGYYASAYRALAMEQGLDLAATLTALLPSLQSIDADGLILLLLLPFAILLSRLIMRERCGVAYFFGFLLSLGGMVLLTLGL